MTDSPLYDATLSDLLLQARRGAERAQARAALTARRAAEEAERVKQEAAIQVTQAHKEAAAVAAAQIDEVRRRAEHEARQERVRRAFVAEQAEERVRAALVAVPPLPPLVGRTAAVDGPAEDNEQEAPPVPSMAELLRPTPGVTRFLDTLLGSSEP